MSEKYTLDEVREHLEKLYNRLESKGREDGFWVIASRSDFKPIKIEETIKGDTIRRTLVKISDIKKEVLKDKEQYFKGKKLSEEHKLKIGLANKGKKSGLGLKRSDEIKRKMSESAKIREAKKRELRNN